MNALEVKDLTKTFDGITAVDNASFEVPEGSIFGLIGRNGAGKTTTIRMMMNIYTPDRGGVYLKEEKIDNGFAIDRVTTIKEWPGFKNPAIL